MPCHDSVTKSQGIHGLGGRCVDRIVTQLPAHSCVLHLKRVYLPFQTHDVVVHAFYSSPATVRCSLPALTGVCGCVQALQQKARQGTLLTDVLQIDETTSPDEAGTLISLCLSSNPLSRPSAARCAAALEHIKATLAADTDALPEMPATDAP